MKKTFITMLAMLMFSIAFSQTKKTKNTPKKQKQTELTNTNDSRTVEQQKKAAEKNIEGVEKSYVVPTPPASVPGNVNTNSSAMPQVTPPVSSPPPGAPISPDSPPAVPDRKKNK